MNYQIAFFVLIAVLTAGLVWVVLFRSNTRTTNPTASAVATPVAAANPSTPRKPWPVMEVLWVLTSFGVIALFAHQHEWQLYTLVQPIALIGMAVSITFLSIIIFGARKHLKVDSNGAMHAVTIIAVLSYVTVLLVGIGYIITELLFGASAGRIREAARSQIAEQWDPTRDGNAITTWEINWVGTGLTIALIAMAIALVYGFSKSTMVRNAVWVISIFLLIWILPKTIVTEIPEEYRLTPEDIRVLPSIDQLLPFRIGGNSPRSTCTDTVVSARNEDTPQFIELTGECSNVRFQDSAQTSYTYGRVFVEDVAGNMVEHTSPNGMWDLFYCRTTWGNLGTPEGRTMEFGIMDHVLGANGGRMRVRVELTLKDLRRGGAQMYCPRW